ncbi:MAG: ORF6N domain-containing protein [Chitinophagaceae bacterium]
MVVEIIQNKIYEINGQKVMLDFDIAELYQVETRVLNQAVKRNGDRFPEDFMFQLTREQWRFLISQIVTSKTETRGGTQKMPFAFTEHGVSMLASVLRSKRAIDMNIAIIRAFIAIKKVASTSGNLHEQINELRMELRDRIGEHDVQLTNIYDALENLLDKQTDKEAAKAEWEQRERIGFKKTIKE